jgi:hypothetical protein
MAKANEQDTPPNAGLLPLLLPDVFRHIVALTRKPDDDIRSEILEAMRSGKLSHLVERTTRYLPRPAEAPTSELPPMEVTHNKPIPSEVLTPGVPGGLGSLHIDWRNGRATRRAGATWDRIEFEGVRCSRERMLALWPRPVAQTETSEESIPAESPRVLDTTEWLDQEVARRKAAGKVPRGYGAKKAFSNELELQMDRDFKEGKVLKALSAGRISNLLRERGHW